MIFVTRQLTPLIQKGTNEFMYRLFGPSKDHGYGGMLCAGYTSEEKDIYKWRFHVDRDFFRKKAVIYLPELRTEDAVH